MEPKDKWHIVYAIVVLQGLAAALPWNVFVTESEYFALRTHVPPYNPAVADNFENVNAIISQSANMLGFLLYVPFQRCMSMEQQVLQPQVLTLIIMACGAWVSINLALGGNAVALITLGSQILIGLTNATITGGVFAMAAWLPPMYVQGMSLGIGLSGVGVSLISFVTLLLSPATAAQVKTPAQVAPEAFSYFVLSSVIIGAAVATYLVFFRTSFVRYHTQPHVVEEWDWHAEHSPLKEPLIPPLPSPAAAAAAGPSLGTCGEPEHAVDPITLAKPLASPIKPALYERLPRGDSGYDDELTLWQILHRMMGYNVVAVITLFVSAAAFPGITSAICSEKNAAEVAPCAADSPYGRFYGDLFVPFMFLVFNFGDFTGRWLAGLKPWRDNPPPMPFLIVYSCARALLVAALLFCNVVTASPWQLPVLLKSDVWSIGIVVLLGITNGHVQSLSMMHAPGTLPRGFARDRCGPILNLCMTLGCTLGSVVSFLITYNLQRGGT